MVLIALIIRNSENIYFNTNIITAKLREEIIKLYHLSFSRPYSSSDLCATVSYLCRSCNYFQPLLPINIYLKLKISCRTDICVEMLRMLFNSMNDRGISSSGTNAYLDSACRLDWSQNKQDLISNPQSCKNKIKAWMVRFSSSGKAARTMNAQAQE